MLAGTNGAGKSSLGGAMIRARQGGDYFNPDERAQELRSRMPSLGVEESNGRAWQEGRQALQDAIAEAEDYAFETTLGGSSIVSLLEIAAEAGFEVRIWYAGLSSPELHIERVRARVAQGGHDIPEAKIRERFDLSRRNLIRLLPCLAELRVYDNSQAAEPPLAKPIPTLVLHVKKGRVITPNDLENTPELAQDIVAAAFALSASKKDIVE